MDIPRLRFGTNSRNAKRLASTTSPRVTPGALLGQPGPPRCRDLLLLRMDFSREYPSRRKTTLIHMPSRRHVFARATLSRGRIEFDSRRRKINALPFKSCS